ncbi:MAG TPA: lipoprotein [Bradyrhizobium sp.]
MRFAVVGTLAVALGLAGCGRKSGLDLPPSAAAVPATTPAETPAAANEPQRNLLGINSNNNDDKPVAGATPQRKSFFLDWLLN